MRNAADKHRVAWRVAHTRPVVTILASEPFFYQKMEGFLRRTSLKPEWWLCQTAAKPERVPDLPGGPRPVILVPQFAGGIQIPHALSSHRHVYQKFARRPAGTHM